MDGKKPLYRLLALTTVFLASVLLVFVPSGSAQTACTAPPGQLTLNPSLTGPTDLLRPITGTPQKLTLTVDYTYSTGAWSLTPVIVTIGAAPAGPSVPYTTLTIAKKSAPIQLPTSQATASGGDGSFTVGMTLQFTKDAPAYQPVKLTATVQSAGGNCVAHTAAAGADFTSTVDFYSKFQARLGKTIIKTGQNSPIALPLILQNFGNGQILVDFERTDEAKDLKVVVPPSTVVESKIAGGSVSEATINLEVNTPFKNGYENRLDQIRMKMTPKSFDDSTKKGDPAEVSALIRTQGVYVPGFDVPLALAGVAIAGLLAARRRP